MDILDTLPELKVCVGYRINGKEIDYFPSTTTELGKVEAIYERVDGWLSLTEGVRSIDKLPHNARKYIQFIEQYLDIPGKYNIYLDLLRTLMNLIIKNSFFFFFPVKWIGVGAGRESVITL